MKRIPMYAFLFLMVMFISLPAHAQSITWNTDQMLSVSTEIHTHHNVAVSGDRAVAVWVNRIDGFTRIFASYSTDRGETWSAPQLIENRTAHARNPRVAMSGSKVVVIWEQMTPTIYKVYANYSTNGGATWLATASPLVLSETTGWDVSQTSVAISGDRVVVVWRQSPDGTYEGIYANRSSDSGATWGTSFQISDYTSADVPQVAISGSNVVAVWRQSAPANDNYFLVRTNYSTNGGATWQDAAWIENPTAEESSRPQVAVSGNNVVAVWDTWDGSYLHIHSNRAAFSGGALAWNTANVQLLEEDETDYYDYDAKIAMSGNDVIVLWQREDIGGNLWLQTVRSGNAGSSWSSPATLDSNAASFQPLHQLIMTDRYAVAIWQYRDVFIGKIRVSSSFDRGENWTDPETIENSTIYDSGNPQIAASGNNIVSVYSTWDSDESESIIYANSASYSGGGFIVLADGGGGGCFIATTAFGSPMAGQVDILRKFRDGYLLTNGPGRKFVDWYYQNGPAAAKFIENKPLAKAFVQASLYPLVGFSFLLINGYLPFVMIGLMLAALIFFRFRPGKSGAR